MDPRGFRDAAPGQLVRIASHGGWAFVPAELPHQWAIPPQLWPVIADVRQLLGELEGIGRAVPNPEVILKPLRDREVLDSSTLEGTITTPHELMLEQLQAPETKANTNPTTSREVENAARAMEYALGQKGPLKLSAIKEIHRILLGGVRGDEKQPGEFRTAQVAIGRTLRYVPPPPPELPRLLTNFEAALSSTQVHEPLVDAFLQHYQFEAIHPFLDGNGRTGRVLLAHSTARISGITQPWLLLSSYFERHRRQYLDRLQRVSTHGDFTNWIEFCLKAAREQSLGTIRRCTALLDAQAELINQIAALKGNLRLTRLLKLLFVKQYMTIPLVARELEVTYPTAAADLEKLLAAGILERVVGAPQKTYFSPKLFALAFED